MTHANCPRCGGRLARDNDSGRCTPCQAAERDRLSAPPVVPASFWEHEPVRHALAERHLGRVIRAYRCHPYHGRAALPQTVVAEWLGITQAQLSRVENGPPLVHLDRLAHWARLLGIPAPCLWFALPGQSQRSAERAEIARAATDPQAAGPDEGRRALLAGIAAVAAGAGLLGGSERAQSRRIGTADIARLNAVLELYRSVDRESGGGLLYREVARFAESVYRMLDWSHPAGLTPPLITAVATARQLAGWTALDAGRHDDAQRHFVAGERAALTADSGPLVAMIRYAQVKQLQHLRHNRDALATLQLTHAQLGSQATPAVRALLWGAEAASIAALGDHETAVRTLGKASDQFERINKEREPAWMGFYDRGELFAQYGRVYRDMARRDRRHASEAVRWGRDSIAAFGAGNVRSTVLNEAGLCSALFLADEPEQALVIGARVLKQAQTMSSRRVIDRIVNLRRDLARHRGLPEVAEFDRVIAARPAGAA
ncbi:helix-turn-helix transcriptional regulator [Micromonospora sp. DH14]|uniref:helix-turn-helix domain-containing protein n=1 Tax=Micromonospora sp. DH14 TaxID=3040120 RepID=UPI002442F782|nr:helix-turn-helix transcriptional regulator [Micromonospora sp. DH14]MDG9675173.1 helix-turn-helix transcriptional regulator [Micromonospora sp. DH14]